MLVLSLIILIMTASLSLCFISQLRLATYARKHPLPESKYTSLFGFVRLSYVNFIYIVAVIGHAFLFVFFTIKYVI
jgi:hypothetical protein